MEEAKLSSEEIMAYVKFCFRSDISKKLKKAKDFHQLAIDLYKKATGIEIPLRVSHNHLRKWMIVKGELVPISSNSHKE